ncbi:hexokinase type 2-like [Ruditapes philippinarum]|uniref:hexokinase type 2-like n=1 Tax=Ruditapes philippinarum TaxID=129788 RepID=UPI00295B5A9E|nr:hexokinase type 2-like [Ruditapes philippinarum]
MEPLSSRKRIQAIASKEKRELVERCLSPEIFDSAKLERMIKTFEDEIKLANSTDGNLRKKTDLFWENTFVRRLLDGTENGTYLGLDLGGTNFRVVRVDMKNGKAETQTKYYNLDKTLLSGPSSVMFDYIANCLSGFLSDGTFPKDAPIPLGFTFSFPSQQKSLKHSTLSTWTKSITCTDGPGLDSVVLLEEAIERRGSLPVPVDVLARISDTTGTLLAGNLVDDKCRIGLIIGTGSNAAFVEYKDNIEKWDSCYKDDDPSDIVVINCEFGAFGDNGCLDFMKTEFDHELDKYSNHPSSYTFEKLYAGHYLGELVRLVLVKLTSAGVLYGGKGSDSLMTRWNLTTSHVTAIERDTDADTSNTVSVLKEMNLMDVCSDEDISLTREVCELVSKRGAYIVATAMVVLLNHINLPEVTIAIDGSLYEHHPKYHQHMMDVIKKWRPQTKTTIKLVKDGSGQGGALVAAIARKSHAR